MADKYDKLLKEGLIRLKEAEFSSVPSEDDIEHEFSENYLKAKEKLLNKLDQSYWKYVNTVAKKVAVIIVTLIIAFTSLMTVDAFRETVINFVITIYQTFTQIEQNEEKESYVETYFSFYKTPIGYEKSFENISNTIYTQMWANSNNENISLIQVAIQISNQFDSEHGELKEAIINNTPSFICQDNNYFFCYWEFDGYRFELIYPADLGEEFMSEVVGNLIEIDPEDMQN